MNTAAVADEEEAETTTSASTVNILITNPADKTQAERAATGDAPVWRTVPLDGTQNALEPKSNFGNTRTYAQMYPPSAFRPVTSETRFSSTADVLRCVNPTTTRTFIAPVHLPTGARPTGIVAILTDNQAGSDINLSLSRTCNGGTLIPDANLSTSNLAFLNSSGSSGQRRYYSGSVTDTHNVNNLQCAYYLQADYNACNIDHEINRVAVQYRRDITPAPTTAPFNDIPVGHPFAAEINALKNSGITGGVGDGSNFGPDQTLTRGQMAAFLARALGLSWQDRNGITIPLPPIIPPIPGP